MPLPVPSLYDGRIKVIDSDCQCVGYASYGEVLSMISAGEIEPFGTRTVEQLAFVKLKPGCSPRRSSQRLKLLPRPLHPALWVGPRRTTRAGLQAIAARERASTLKPLDKKKFGSRTIHFQES